MKKSITEYDSSIWHDWDQTIRGLKIIYGHLPQLVYYGDEDEDAPITVTFTVTTDDEETSAGEASGNVKSIDDRPAHETSPCMKPVGQCSAVFQNDDEKISNYCNVKVASDDSKWYTYLVPEGVEVEIDARVIVPFGAENLMVVGRVIALGKAYSYGMTHYKGEIKYIKEVI